MIKLYDVFMMWSLVYFKFITDVKIEKLFIIRYYSTYIELRAYFVIDHLVQATS